MSESAKYKSTEKHTYKQGKHETYKHSEKKTESKPAAPQKPAK
jgi:hypothetical protein